MTEALVQSPDGERWMRFIAMWQAIGVGHSILRLDTEDDNPLHVAVNAGTAIVGLVMRVNQLEWMVTQLMMAVAASNPMLMAQITLGELAARGRAS